MAINAPMISLNRTFSLKKIIARGINIMGTIDIMVAAMPTAVYLIAIRENDTPRKGPKTAPIVVNVMALPCFNAI